MSITQAPIYLDNQATTPIDPRVKDKMLVYLGREFGNASSGGHAYGHRANHAIYDAKHSIGSLLNADPDTVIFTSGTTESISLAIVGYVMRHYKGEPLRLGTLEVEHKAVLATCDYLQKKGFITLSFLPLNQQGELNIEDVKTQLEQGLDFLVVMAANNEVGNIYPVKAIGRLCQQYNVPFFCDASQAVGKIPLSFENSGITFLAFTGHKMYGPKGCGAILIQKGVELEPLIHGGGQQRGLRSGTFNVHGIAGLGEACRLRELEMQTDEARIAFLRDTLFEHLKEGFPALLLNGTQELTARLAGNLNLSFCGIENRRLMALVGERLALSTGSACDSGLQTGSYVLQAMGLKNTRVQSAIRIGLGKFTTQQEVTKAAEILIKALHKLIP